MDAALSVGVRGSLREYFLRFVGLDDEMLSLLLPLLSLLLIRTLAGSTVLLGCCDDCTSLDESVVICVEWRPTLVRSAGCIDRVHKFGVFLDANLRLRYGDRADVSTRQQHDIAIMSSMLLALYCIL